MGNVLVYIETDEGTIRKSSLEAVTYACQMAQNTNDRVTGVVLGTLSHGQEDLALYGADEMIWYNDSVLEHKNLNILAGVLGEIFIRKNASCLVMAKSSLSDILTASVAVKTGSSPITNVCSLPESFNPFRIKRSVFGGKAFEIVQPEKEKSVISILKNVCGLEVNKKEMKIIESGRYPGNLPLPVSRVVSKDKKTGGVLLDEASVVVSAGRGLKGPENWGMIEELASALGAATACSKPVSDAGWRPHSEHVGQTGLKIAPNLYIAIGISGAIQHLAGVNSSRVILVINKDPEAPFFKAADYGLVGDAFELVPALTEEIKKLK